jgi:DNA modification methylase
MANQKPIRGFLFACTDKSEYESLSGLLFATEGFYGPIVIRIRKGDLIFLNNINTDKLFGVFKTITNGGINLRPKAFNGKYPYQVEVKPVGDIIEKTGAKKLLGKHAIKRNRPLIGTNLIKFLEDFVSIDKQLKLATNQESNKQNKSILKQIDILRKGNMEIDIEEEIPLIESTTFWDFPKQSYGLTPKGDNKYAGVTPALIIYNLIWRYTRPKDLVVDPMCGSGTTIDVCKAEKRKVKAYDISPTRPDIIQNDARKIPLKSNSADMIFIDSPYGDNIKYNTHPDNIGNISSESTEFYDELEKVMVECKRILKDGKVLGWLIGDQWVKNKFTPVGFKIYERLCKHFEPVDIICVNRRGQSSNTGVWHNRARRFNFFLRGFKYLIIVRNISEEPRPKKTRKVEWAYYQRGRK